ncbi:MAG: DUF3080 family protein [Gammaproteobacteria bacterium]|nr:DUF3080 family protein [Gammaproteobacteria bacterium]
MRPGAILLPALVLLCASGCEPADPARALLDDYRTRMGRVLEVDPGPLPEVELAPWPRARDRTLEVPAQRINLIEFLRLHRCDLGELVGARSSPLGRVMQPSQGLRYEIRFLRRADACLERLGAQPDAQEEATRLAGLVAAKRTALGAVIWNATLGTTHWRTAMPCPPPRWHRQRLGGPDAKPPVPCGAWRSSPTRPAGRP